MSSELSCFDNIHLFLLSKAHFFVRICALNRLSGQLDDTVSTVRYVSKSCRTSYNLFFSTKLNSKMSYKLNTNDNSP